MSEDITNMDDDSPATRGPGIIGLIKALAFITIIVIVEVVAASMFIPTAYETEKLAREIVSASNGDETASNVGESTVLDGQLDTPMSEVLIGTYNVTRFNPETGTTLTIDVEIHGAVLAEEEDDFLQRFEKNKGRVGEQVIMTFHSAEGTDLTEAGLGLIKRKILEKTNRALGKPLVRELLFSKFNFVER